MKPFIIPVFTVDWHDLEDDMFKSEEQTAPDYADFTTPPDEF